jgi:hypothetical protein
MNLQGAFTELDVLTTIYKNPRDFHAFTVRYEKEFFDDKYRLFFSVVQDYYKKFGKTPPKSAFNIELNAEDKENCFTI